MTLLNEPLWVKIFTSAVIVAWVLAFANLVEHWRDDRRKRMTVYEVVRKLIGRVTPFGETAVDRDRYENLDALIELTDHLITDIENVASFRHRPEASMMRAGTRAQQFIENLKEGL